MIVTVFRSRLCPGVQEEYGPLAERLAGLVRAVPGYLGHNGFTADDGERVTIVEFADEDGLRAWSAQPEHVAAKRRAWAGLFSAYRVQVCRVLRDHRWPASP